MRLLDRARRASRAGLLLLLTLCLPLALAASPHAPARAQAAAEAVGRVTAAVGTVLVTGPDGSGGGGEARRLTEGAPVFQGDRIETAAGSRVRLEFVDESVVSLGENCAFTIDWFLYAPAIDLRSVLFLVPRGILRLVASLVPDSTFELRTNTAVASVRGTDWMAEATADSTAVVVLDGRVAVGNALGAVVLSEGEGTDVAAGEPPTPPVRWGAARVQRFLQATAVP